MSNDFWNRPTPEGSNDPSGQRPDEINGPAAGSGWEPNSLANDETRYGSADDTSQTPYGPAGNTNYNTYGPTDGADFSGNEQPGGGDIPEGEHRGVQPAQPAQPSEPAPLGNQQHENAAVNHGHDPRLTRDGSETTYGAAADQVENSYGPAGNENYNTYGPTDGADYSGYGQPAAEHFNTGGDDHPKAEGSYAAGSAYGYGQQSTNDGTGHGQQNVGGDWQSNPTANYDQQQSSTAVDNNSTNFGASTYGQQPMNSSSYPESANAGSYGSATPTNYGGENASYPSSNFGDQGYGSNGYGTGATYNNQGAGSYGEQNNASTYGQQAYGSGSYGDQSYGQAYGDQNSTSYGQQTYSSGSYGDQSYGQQSYGDPNQSGYGTGGYPTGYPAGGSYQEQVYGGYNAAPGYGMQAYGGYAAAYSSWAKRAQGALIDHVAPGVAMGTVTGVLQSNGSSIAAIISTFVYLAGVAFIIYNSGYLAGTTGQSYGRKIAGTRLVNESTGQPIGFGMAVLRQLVHFLDSLACYVGWLWPLWDDKRQTFADKIMSTVVIADNGQSQQQAQQTPPQGY